MATLVMNTTTPKMTLGNYHLTATRGEDEVLRQCFSDPDDANSAVAEALVRYPDCEIRLTRRYTVLLSAGPAPSARGRARARWSRPSTRSTAVASRTSAGTEGPRQADPLPS
jgi:hypothetical protein